MRFLRISFGVVLLHRGVDGGQLSVSLIQSDSWSETPEKLRHAMDAASDHGCRKMMRTGDHVGDDFGILWIGDTRLEHANDDRRPITDATEANGFADDRRILAQSGGPETVRKNNDARSVRAV